MRRCFPLSSEKTGDITYFNTIDLNRNPNTDLSSLPDKEKQEFKNYLNQLPVELFLINEITNKNILPITESILNEIKRRIELFSETRSSNLDEFIIKTNNKIQTIILSLNDDLSLADFTSIQNLSTISRIGRSLGIEVISFVDLPMKLSCSFSKKAFYHNEIYFEGIGSFNSRVINDYFRLSSNITQKRDFSISFYKNQVKWARPAKVGEYGVAFNEDGTMNFFFISGIDENNNLIIHNTKDGRIGFVSKESSKKLKKAVISIKDGTGLDTVFVSPFRWIKTAMKF